ncbi:MAG: hypothetical protein R3B06_04920 [Kofleriaceae bacterium]
MPPPWSTRLKVTLRPPARTNVRSYLAARAAGDLAGEDRFFWQLQLASGVFKATNRDRFVDTFEALQAAVPRDRSRLRVLDVACSSGISTVELHRALARPGLDLETIGTDITIRVHHATLYGDAVVFDDAGNLLAAEIDGMLINRHPNRAVRLHHPFRVWRAQRLIARHQPRVGVPFHPPAGATVTEVPLVSSEVARTPGVRVEEEDLFAPHIAGEFDLIRAANILNRGYFSDAQLTTCVRALVARTTLGGLLFVTRTERGANHGTLWRRAAGGLVPVATVGAGCEIATLVTAAATPLAGEPR